MSYFGHQNCPREIWSKGWAFGGDDGDDGREEESFHLHHRDPIPKADRVCQAHHLEMISRFENLTGGW